MLLGGYQLIDIKGIDCSGSGAKIPGAWSALKNSNGKRVIFSGAVDSEGVVLPDCEIDFTETNTPETTVSAPGWGGAYTVSVSYDDTVIIDEAVEPLTLKFTTKDEGVTYTAEIGDYIVTIDATGISAAPKE